MKLAEKGVPLNPQYIRCGDPEDIEHMIFGCEFARGSWELWESGGFGLHTMTWKDENQSPQQVYQHYIRVLRSWKEAMALKDIVRPVGQGSTTLQASESTLEVDWIFSVEAAVFSEQQKSGYGFIIRKNNGQFLYAVSGTFHGVFKA
ncbi:hypothetical protein ACFE04_001825 [Oxalis oulophora]